MTPIPIAARRDRSAVPLWAASSVDQSGSDEPHPIFVHGHHEIRAGTSHRPYPGRDDPGAVFRCANRNVVRGFHTARGRQATISRRYARSGAIHTVHGASVRQPSARLSPACWHAFVDLRIRTRGTVATDYVLQHAIPLTDRQTKGWRDRVREQHTWGLWRQRFRRFRSGCMRFGRRRSSRRSRQSSLARPWPSTRTASPAERAGCPGGGAAPPDSLEPGQRLLRLQARRRSQPGRSAAGDAGRPGHRSADADCDRHHDRAGERAGSTSSTGAAGRSSSLGCWR